MKLSKLDRIDLKSGSAVRCRHGGYTRGLEVLHDISVNINPAGPPDFLKDSACRALSGIVRYPEYDCAALKNAASSYYGVKQEEIVCGNGTSELLDAVGRLFSGKKVLLPIPCYTGYERAFRNSEKVFIQLSEDADFDITDSVTDSIADILERIRPAVVVIGNPSNPAGRLTGKKQLEKLLGSTGRIGCTLVIDESFIEICDEGEAASMVDVTKHYDNLLIFRSLTKSYAVPGLRLGFAISGNPALLSQISDELPEWNISSFASGIGIDILSWENSRIYLEDSREQIISLRHSLLNHLSDGGIRAVTSCTDYILVNTPRPLYDEMLEKKVLIRDCSDISGLGKDWYRLAVCSASASIVF